MTEPDRLEPLLDLVHAKGMATTEHDAGEMDGDAMKSPAYIVFPLLADAMEFMLAISHVCEYRLQDNMVLSIVHPETDLAGTPRGKVTWIPSFTPWFVRDWV